MSIVLLSIIVPTLGIKLFDDGLTFVQFMLLVFSTILIAVGGYIINDVFDIHADGVNKKNSSPVGNSISIETANILYWVFTIVGVLLGVLLSYLVNQINFGLIFLFSAGLLWFYSQKYQCLPLVGNIVVAFLSALSFGLVWLFEFYALSSNAEVFVAVQSKFSLVNRLVVIYMGFAFVVSLLREVVKDIEDYEGDNRFGCITFAVKYGINASKIIALIIAYFSLFASVLIQYEFFNKGLYLLTSAFFIIDVLFISVILMLHKASAKANYTKLSLLIKFLMLFGIISMITVYFEM
ncbi:MAG: geranylgeranylglycerol-phosphate geranylgeranyltransferase [Bacteroidota bacterium]